MCLEHLMSLAIRDFEERPLSSITMSAGFVIKDFEKFKFKVLWSLKTL